MEVKIEKFPFCEWDAMMGGSFSCLLDAILRCYPIFSYDVCKLNTARKGLSFALRVLFCPFIISQCFATSPIIRKTRKFNLYIFDIRPINFPWEGLANARCVSRRDSRTWWHSERRGVPRSSHGGALKISKRIIKGDVRDRVAFTTFPRSNYSQPSIHHLI